MALAAFSVVQKIFSIGSTYTVYENSQSPAFTVRGKLLTMTPKLEAREGDNKDGKVLSTVTGNFFKTNFVITDAAGTTLASIKFPLISFLKNFTITIGEKTYKTKAGILSARFSCKDEAGQDIFTIVKELAFRDKFMINVEDTKVNKLVGVMAAIVIDQKFFQKKN